MKKEIEKEFVYCGVVYMGNNRWDFEKIISKKYGNDAELRNYTNDYIHGDRAELYATQDILDKDFGGRPKLIS